MSKPLQRAARNIGLVLVPESISGLPDCGGRDRFHLVTRMRIDRNSMDFLLGYNQIPC
ncbi:hypothetical protein RB4627 [Rhodopirellula baltica SH 1]|uniref:Uncharacterized protein n=1 Tax=Rhodopirellula baltica (strain DSM 10527 / NCIMB 13988 / SH1) TaxID=243090 RepID=Q7USA2_RHOBA|nr:hypothetical protein RB4627 [Rhodopirellula baltica SH 1]